VITGGNSTTFSNFARDFSDYLDPGIKNVPREIYSPSNVEHGAPLRPAPSRPVAERMSRTMKVLRVIPTLDPETGGPPTTIVHAAIAERQASFEPTIVFTGDERSVTSTAPARARLDDAGVRTLMFPRVQWLPPSIVSRWGISRQMSAWLLRNARHYDVIHIDYVWAWSTLIAAIAGSRAGRPVVMTAHESLTSFGVKTRSGSDSHNMARVWMQAKLWMRRFLMRYIDLVVMTSDMEHADSMRPNERAVVIPHAVVAEAPKGPVTDPPFPPLVVGYIGRLHPKKNIEVLLRSVAALETSTNVIVCGDGDQGYRAQLHRLADDLSLTPQVEWRGHVDAAGRANLFAQSHVVAMPSTYECFGMAAAEAMAAGVPVIVSKTTGVAPIVDEYDCGKLVEAGDVDSLRDALADIASDVGWRHQARINSLRAASANYSYDSYAERIGAVYAELVV
jgi:glycosyltransferase involved in cell wall biosynthesis